jgi:hypothetical protein
MVITTMSSTIVKAHFELKVESLKLKGFKVLKSTPLSPNPFSPDPRVDSRFNLSGCPRMTYEDDIRVEGEEFVAPSFPLPRGKELRIGVCFLE